MLCPRYVYYITKEKENPVSIQLYKCVQVDQKNEVISLQEE